MKKRVKLGEWFSTNFIFIKLILAETKAEGWVHRDHCLCQWNAVCDYFRRVPVR